MLQFIDEYAAFFIWHNYQIMRTSLEFPPEQLARLKVLAALHNGSLRQTVMGAIERGLRVPVGSSATGMELPSVSLGAPMALTAQQLKSGELSAYLPKL